MTRLRSVCHSCEGPAGAAATSGLDGLDGSSVRRTLNQALPANANAQQIAAYIYNLLASGNTGGAASAIAEASAQGSTGANGIATALATASSQVRLPSSHMLPAY